MKNKTKFYTYLLILICSLFFPITVKAEDNEISEPWEIDVTMEITDSNDGLYESSFHTNGMSSSNKTSAWNKVFTEYKGIIVGVSGVCTLTFVFLFILNFMKLGQCAGNPQLRSQALMTLLWTGIASACCGGVTLFVGFSHNLFKQ